MNSIFGLDTYAQRKEMWKRLGLKKAGKDFDPRKHCSFCLRDGNQYGGCSYYCPGPIRGYWEEILHQECWDKYERLHVESLQVNRKGKKRKGK